MSVFADVFDEFVLLKFLKFIPSLTLPDWDLIATTVDRVGDAVVAVMEVAGRNLTSMADHFVANLVVVGE